MTSKAPDFQETLKRMLKSPPKENKPLNAEGGKDAKKSTRKNSKSSAANDLD